MKKISILLIGLILIFSVTVLAQEEVELSEEQAIELALENNRRIKELQKDIDVAQAELVKARAGYYPSLDLSGSYTRQESFGDEDEISLPAGFEDLADSLEQPANNFGLQFSLQQLIYSGGARSAAYQQAERAIEIVKIELKQEKIELAQEIREEYYNLLKAEQMINLINQSLTRVERYLEIAQQNYELGLATNTDLLQARINKNRLQQELLAAENNVELAVMYFKNSLGLAEQKEIKLTDQLDYQKLDVDYKEAQKQALEDRLELEILSLQQANLELNREQIKSAKRPQVIFNADYGARGSELMDAFQLHEGDLQATIAISYNLFDGGSNQADSDILAKELEKFALNQKELVDLIKLDVKEQVNQLEQRAEELKLKELSYQLASENLEQNQAKYEAGTITSLDLLEAEDAYQEAEIDYYQGIYDYHLAVFAYKKSLGLGL